jgi:hypothetical protein
MAALSAMLPSVESAAKARFEPIADVISKKGDGSLVPKGDTPLQRNSETALGLGCVKTSDEHTKCRFGATVEISAPMISIT